jgi:hypothetical protein
MLTAAQTSRWSDEERLVSNEPVDLDDRRTAAEKVAAEFRRHSQKDLEADRGSLLLRMRDLEAHFLAEPAETWREVAAKVHYLIRRYAETAEAQGSLRKQLIERVLSDIARLTERESEER